MVSGVVKHNITFIMYTIYLLLFFFVSRKTRKCPCAVELLTELLLANQRTVTCHGATWPKPAGVSEPTARYF